MKLIDRIVKPENELSKYLTVRTVNNLRNMGIETIEALYQADDIELLKYPTFGKKGLTECLDFLTKHHQAVFL